MWIVTPFLTKPVCPGLTAAIISTDSNEAQSSCEIDQATPSVYTMVVEVRELNGANISLFCMCHNSDGVESWRFGNVFLTNGSALNITRLSGATAGPYTCTNMTNASSTVLVRAISKLS